MPNDYLGRPRFPGNSLRKKVEEESLANTQPQKNVQRVVRGRIKVKKKSFLNNLSQSFFGETTDSVLSYILTEVLLPAAKNTISEMVSGGIEMLLFGETKGSVRRNKDPNKTYVSYGSFYNKDRPREAPRRAARQFDDIILENRAEAQEVLDDLVELIENYDSASVADFYDLIGTTGDHTDHKFGWTNLSRAAVERVRDGYIVALPRPIPLD
jgi:hypothetical protein